MDIPIFTPNWTDYELIDSGQGAKLERFGPDARSGYTIVRPDPRALWQQSAPKEQWDNADATFVRTLHSVQGKPDGDWRIKRAPPIKWRISYKNLVFILKPTSFKHVGVFPEQAVNWDWLDEVIMSKSSKVLNLFAYTGGSTIAAALAGAHVTHVDSAKSAIEWAKENAQASGLKNDAIRWIEEDAYKFVLREGRRGTTYDGIILDPPRFGRGAKGEVWKLHEKLPELLAACKAILSPHPRFIMINAYTADISVLAIKHLLEDMMKSYGGNVECGELALKASSNGRLLPNGMVARWNR